MIFAGAAAPSPLAERQLEPEKERRAVKKEDKPCAHCGHLCSSHAPADYTRMYCNSDGCSCEGYFPSKSYQAVVQENIALRSEIELLKSALPTPVMARTTSA